MSRQQDTAERAAVKVRPHVIETSIVDGYEYTAEWIAESAPNFWAASRDVMAVPVLAPFTTATAYVGSEVVDLICNQAVNDFVDLLVALRHGQGRAAVRAARTLFEHRVALLDVLNDPDAASRYLAHREVMENLDWQDDRMDAMYPTRVRRAIARRRKQRVIALKQPVADAFAKYGTGFRRGWAGRSLRDRANAQGLSQDYDSYAVMSALIHGSAHGAASTRFDVDDRIVNRSGGAIGDSPFAMFHGIQSFRGIVDALCPTAFDETLLEETNDALDVLMATWREYAYAVVIFNGEQIPKENPPFGDRVAVVKLTPQGGRQWYLHLPRPKIVRRAYPPDLAEYAYARDAIADAQRQAPLDPADWDQAVTTIGFGGIRVRVKADAKWQPDNTLVIQRLLGGVSVAH